MNHRKISAKGGAAGRGAAKARTSEHARAAAHARWGKRLAQHEETGATAYFAPDKLPRRWFFVPNV